jgi:hypothetical protein
MQRMLSSRDTEASRRIWSAMVWCHRGDAVKAKAELQRAVDLLGKPQPRGQVLDWEGRLEIDILRKEIEDKLKQAERGAGGS